MCAKQLGLSSCDQTLFVEGKLDRKSDISQGKWII
jgi:hypothetical protein